MARTSSARDTSAWTKRALPPADPICSTVSRPPASATSATTTLAPSLAKRSAASRPMPLPAPVISATLSLRRIVLASLEEARLLPVRHGLVELPLLRAKEMDVVVHELLAECPTRKGTRREPVRRVSQALRNPRERLGRVGVPPEDGRRLRAERNPVQPRGESSGVGQIRVRVGARDAALDPQRGTLSHHTETRCPVVVAPGDGRGSERRALETLVGVDRGSREGSQFFRMCHPASEKPAEEIAPGNRAERRRAGEEILHPGGVPEGEVLVQGASREFLVPLRHERHGEVLTVGDLLGRVLGQDIPVGLLEEIAVSDVQLLLTRPPLPLGALHRHAARCEAAYDRSDEGLLPRPLQDVVVLDVATELFEILETFPARGVVRLAEDVHLQLRARPRLESHCPRAVDLAREDSPRRDLDRLAIRLADDVAEHDRRLLEPGRAAQRLPVGDASEVAVALLPAREVVARDRIHLHVAGKQVIARVQTMGRHVLDEETANEPLAQETPVEIREGGQNGLGFARLDKPRELLLSELAWNGFRSCLHFPSAARRSRREREASLTAERCLGGRVGSEPAQVRRAARERLDGAVQVLLASRRGDGVKIEEVLEARAPHGAALDLGHVDAAERERAESLEEGGGSVLHPKEERSLERTRIAVHACRALLRPGNQEEPGEVHRVVLEFFREHDASVDLGSAETGDGRGVAPATADHFLRGGCRVVHRYRFDPRVLLKKPLALEQSHRMGEHAADLFERDSPRRDERVGEAQNC